MNTRRKHVEEKGMYVACGQEASVSNWSPRDCSHKTLEEGVKV